MFNCERASVVLIHRYRLYSFRIVKDKDKVDMYQTHDMGKGITGQVAMSAKSYLTDEIDKQFVQEIDDPNYKQRHGVHPAMSLVSCPVFTQDEMDHFGS